jgi:hypothetical protein
MGGKNRIAILLIFGIITASGACSAVVNAQETKKYILSVTPQFNPSDVITIGGTCEWSWPEAGIAVASGFSSSEKISTVKFAVPDIKLVSPDEQMTSIIRNALKNAGNYSAIARAEKFSSEGICEPPPIIGGSDVYDKNGQWALYAIGAAQPVTREGGEKCVGGEYFPKYKPKWLLNDYEGNGITVAFFDTGMPCVNTESIRLHPDFDWYSPTDGGVFPFFKGYEAPANASDPWNYYKNYYYNYADVEELKRLLNPDSLIWKPDGGYDVYNRLAVGIDPELGGFSYPQDHGTQAGGLVGARYWKNNKGAIRGLAPKAKLIFYKNDTLSGMLKSYKRAVFDGVQVSGNSLNAWQPETNKDDEQNYLILLSNAVSELNKANILLVFPETTLSFASKLSNPNLLIVSGTGPRDYDPFAVDLDKYLPHPGGNKNAEYNLDRVMFVFFRPIPVFGSAFGSSIDISSPAGSYNDGMDLLYWALSDSKTMPSAYAMKKANNYLYTTCSAPNAEIVSYYLLRKGGAPYLDTGYHMLSAGTGLSASIVAGVAALAVESYQRKNGAPPSAEKLKKILLDSADDQVGPAIDRIIYWPEGEENPAVVNWNCEKPGRDDFYGKGRINALKAIKLARGE